MTYEQFCSQVLLCYEEILITDLSKEDFDDMKHAAMEIARAGGDIPEQIVTDIFELIYEIKYT